MTRGGEVHDAWYRRYERGELIGEGGFGRVYRGRDTLTGGEVALKVLQADSARSVARARREVSALRALRCPGVVRLLDEGPVGDGHVLVMELIEGSPFPGEPAPAPWHRIREGVIGLLEILARVHQFGLVHRDLKPSNVMVGPDGRVTLLDFGLARSAETGWTLTPAGGVAGTPRYLSPEQILGGAGDARADLYAVGVMIFEALTGGLPHGEEDPVFARLSQEPKRISRDALDVPEFVVEAVARMLARRTGERWNSAAEFVKALRDATNTVSAEGVARAAISEVVAGRGSLPAPPLAAGERRVVPGEAPFESLTAIGSANPDMTLAEFAAHLATTLDALARDGSTLVVDDLQQVDPWSRDLLSRYGGAMLKRPASAEVVLAESDLMELFQGPERLFHLQTDGARELARRTGGKPDEIEVEVAAWARAGLVRWVGRKMVISRAAIDTLRIGYDRLGPANVVALAEGSVLPPVLEDLLAWAALAGPFATTVLLARAMNEPRWRVEARLLELERRGAVRQESEALWAARLRPVAFDRWTNTRRVSTHLALAAVLPEGRDRMIHLLLGDAPLSQVVDAAIAAADTALASGWSGEAFALLEPALGAARDQAAWHDERRLLECLVDCALASDAPAELARAGWELTRAASDTSPLVALVQAWQAYAAGADPGPHLANTGTLPARLELRRFVLSSAYAVLYAPDTADHVIGRPGPVEPLALQVARTNARGRQAYQRLAFDTAAAYHLEAATLTDDWIVRAKSLLNAAAALLEADEPEHALQVARGVLSEACAVRHLVCEAGAECLVRAASYRSGETSRPDEDLVAALEQLGDLRLLGYASMTEAANAWRLGDDAAVGRLAGLASEAYARVANRWGGVLVRALAAASGHGDRSAVEGELNGCELPLVVAQARLLLSGRDARGHPLWRAGQRSGRRREILSVEELEE